MSFVICLSYIFACTRRPAGHFCLVVAASSKRVAGKGWSMEAWSNRTRLAALLLIALAGATAETARVRDELPARL